MLLRAARIAAPRLVAARPALRRAVPPAVVAGISFSIYQSLTTFHALALNMEAPPPSPLQVSGEAVLNADPALGGANVPVAPLSPGCPVCPVCPAVSGPCPGTYVRSVRGHMSGCPKCPRTCVRLCPVLGLRLCPGMSGGVRGVSVCAGG